MNNDSPIRTFLLWIKRGAGILTAFLLVFPAIIGILMALDVYAETWIKVISVILIGLSIVVSLIGAIYDEQY